MSFGTHSMPTSERRSASSPLDAASLRSTRQTRAAGEQLGPPVGEQEHVGLDARGAVQAEAEDAHRHPRVVGRDRRHDRRAVAGALAELAGPLGVELGGHEHGAALRRRSRAPRARRAARKKPFSSAHCPTSSPPPLQDRDVEGVDLRLQHDLAPRPTLRPRCLRGVIGSSAAAGRPPGPGAAASSRRRARPSSARPAAARSTRPTRPRR